MAVAYRGSLHTGYVTANTSISFNSPPTGTAQGDVLIVHLHIESGTLLSITAPSGWHLVGSGVDCGSQLSTYLFWKIAGASESGAAPYTFSWTGSFWNTGSIHGFSGQTGNSGSDNPFGADSNVGTTFGSTSSIASISYTAAGSGLGVWFYNLFNDGSTITQPSGYTASYTQADASEVVATRADSAGSLTTGTATGGAFEYGVHAGTILDTISGGGASLSGSPSDNVGITDSVTAQLSPGVLQDEPVASTDAVQVSATLSSTTANIVDQGSVGTANNKTSGTTLAVTASQTIPAGSLLVCALTCDNAASTTAPTLSLSASGGGTWTQRGSTTGSGVTTTAGAGIWGAVFTCLTTSQITSASTITTITFGTAVVAKIAVIEAFQGVNHTLRNTVASGTSTAGTPSATTTGTALVAGDLVIGTIHGEINATPTADADTTNGSWDAVIGGSTTGSTANTNVAVGIQDKVVTATGAQTYNATTTNDSVAFVFALVPTPQLTATDLDPVGITDSATYVLTPASGGGDVTQPESVGITDAVTVTHDYVTSLNDPVGLTDSANGSFAFSSSTGDPVGITDSPSTVMGYVRTQDEPVGISDSVSTSQSSSGSANPNDPVGITDNVSIVQSFVRSVGDSVGITDTGSEQTIDRVETFDDPVGLTDATSLVRGYGPTPNEPVGITDNVTANLSGSLAANPNDPVGITDAVTLIQSVIKSQDDPVGLSDAVAISIGLTKSQADALGITDATALVFGFDRTQADPEGITDVVSIIQALTKAPNDPVGITDSVTANLAAGINKTQNDPVGITDSLSRVAILDRPLTEAVGITDTVTAIQNKVAVIADPVGLTDAIVALRAGQVNLHVTIGGIKHPATAYAIIGGVKKTVTFAAVIKGGQQKNVV